MPDADARSGGVEPADRDGVNAVAHYPELKMLSVLMHEDTKRVTLRFSHPKGNVITDELVGQMRQALEDLSRSTSLRLLTIEGEGGDFSFGASIPEHAPGVVDQSLPLFHLLILDLLAMPVPTAAVVRGRCLGGGFEIALACDFILAAEDATFALPEITLGVFAPVATVLLPKRVGLAPATSALLTGDSRTAAQGKALGLIEAVAPVDQLAGAVSEWFNATLGRHSAEALRFAVRALRGGISEAAARELPEIEQLYLKDVMRSRDAREGIEAFLEKRMPRWRDE
jgi:cyclohexa-1,5-dienecarbonyl-CoA hydratase